MWPMDVKKVSRLTRGVGSTVALESHLPDEETIGDELVSAASGVERIGRGARI